MIFTFLFQLENLNSCVRRSEEAQVTPSICIQDQSPQGIDKSSTNMSNAAYTNNSFVGDDGNGFVLRNRFTILFFALVFVFSPLLFLVTFYMFSAAGRNHLRNKDRLNWA